MSEPIILPSDYDKLKDWFNLIRHANRVIVCGSLQWVEIGVFIDADGIPQFWEIDDHNLYPRSREVQIRD